MPDVSKVTTGKPKVTGAVFTASAGTALPTDATTALAAAFKELGYAADSGLTNTHSGNVNKIRAWGGDVVMIIKDEVEDKFSLTLIEVTREDVLKIVHGSGNVSGTLATGLTVTYNDDDPETNIWVFEIIYSNDVIKRIVIPRGIVSEVGEVSYTDSDAVGYAITIDALVDNSGNTHYEYIAEAQ